MNAVVRPITTTEGPAAAALRAYRERMREIERQAEPLRGQRAGLETNIAAAEQELGEANAELQAALTAFNDAVAAAPSGAHRDLEQTWSAKRAAVERLSRRVSALRAAIERIGSALGALESRVQQEPVSLTVLQHRALVEGAFTAAVNRAVAAERAFHAAEFECEAVAIALDGLAGVALNQHGVNLEHYAQQFRLARADKRQRESRASLSDAPRPTLQARVAEIRAEVEVEAL